MSNNLNIPHSFPWISEEDINAVSKQLQDGMIANGEMAKKFESEFASKVGYLFALSTSSGTSALIVALIASGVKKGDEVIIPTYVCDSVMKAVRSIGAKVVLCDNGKGWSIESSTIEKKISSKTKAIILVHTFGISAENQSIENFGIPVIHDCCQSLGRTSSEAWIGSNKSIATYSLHPTKCLSGGEGGLLATNDEAIMDAIIDIRSIHKTYFVFSDMQAALARSQLSRYEEILTRRKEIAEMYFSLLPKKNTEKLGSLADKSMFFRFPLEIKENFEEVKKVLDKKGIQVRKGVDSLLHRILKEDDSDYENAVETYKKTLSIPITPNLTDDQISFIAKELCLALDQR